MIKIIHFPLIFSLPGWENRDDDNQRYQDVKISAILIMADEPKEDMGMSITKLEGGVGFDYALFKVKSWDNGHGDADDKYSVYVFGQ